MSPRNSSSLSELDWLQMAANLPVGADAWERRSESYLRDHLIKTRWPNGVTCPLCECAKFSHFPEQNLFQCSSCRHQWSPTTDTPLHQTHLKLSVWFKATELIVRACVGGKKRAPTTHGLAVQLGVAYKTAYRLRQTILTDLEDGNAGLLRKLVCSDIVAKPEKAALINDERSWLEVVVLIKKTAD